MVQGTYLLLEKLRFAAYRRLLRKVCGVHAELEPQKQTQIPLPHFQAALAAQVRLLVDSILPVHTRAAPGGDHCRLQEVALDMDEVECVAANLIFRKYIKGYISHSHKVLVIAKNDPFPLLSTVVLAEL